MKASFLRTLPLLLFGLTLWLLTPHGALAANFIVNNTNDTIDAAPGNGACADAGSQCSLRAAIMEANALSGDDTITLAGSTYMLSITGRGEDGAATGDLDIKAGAVTLIGAGNAGEALTTIINGNGLDRVFDLFTGSNVSMQRLAIVGGDNRDVLDSSFTNGQGGGGIRAWEANLTLNQVVVQGNRSQTHGGGISFTFNDFGRPKLTTLLIHNSRLENNETTINGGGLIIGGAATLHMSNSQVISNTARAKTTSGLLRYGGGGFYIGQGYTPIGGDTLFTTIYLTTTTFTDNFTSDRNNNLITGNAWGGALHLAFSQVSINDSSFVHNAAEGRSGGAIYNDNARLTISNTSFDGNEALDEGGAVSAESVLFTRIDNSVFKNNRAPDEILGGGGAVSGRGQESGGAFLISNSTFENNSTAGSGGALRIGSNSTVINSQFISNSAGGNGGGIAVLRSNIDAPAIIKQVTISNNRAHVRGGGIHNGDVLYLSDSVIRNNTTMVGEGGGVSNYQAYALTITNTDIISNSAAGHGGGLFDSHKTQGSNNIFPPTTRLTDIVIDSNVANGDGGAIYSLSSVQIVNATISNNQAISSGGAILTYSLFQFSSERQNFPTNLDMLNVTLSGNSAAEGGAIYQNGGVSKLNNVTIAGNSASNLRGGGGIYYDKEIISDTVNPNTITMQNTILALNTATVGPDCANTLLTSGNNIIGNNSGCTFNAAAGDQVGTSATPIDPLLGALADNGGPTMTRSLLTNSPAINNGNAATCASSDQRRALRAGICDIGAFEFGSAPKQAQTINFAKPADKSLGDAPFSLSAGTSSNLAVSFNSSTPSICTVSNATVTLVATGTCTITASQEGNDSFLAATPVTQSFNVVAPTKQNQTIDFAKPADKTLGDAPFALNASASSGLAVLFSSNTPSVCTVSETTVTLLAAGTCTITAAQAGDGAFNAAVPVTQSFNINAAPANTTQNVFLPLVRR